MKYLLITLMLLLTFTGCQDKEHDAQRQKEHDAKIVAQTRAKVLAEFEAKKANDAVLFEKARVEASENKLSEKPLTKLNQIGIDMEHGTIVIDTNKTKKFFNNLSQQMQVQMKKISHDIETSIDINSETIHIDLNQTQNLLKTWDKKIKNFVKEFDSITQNTDSNISKEN